MLAELKPIWTKANMEKAMVVVLAMVLLFVLKGRFFGGRPTVSGPAPGVVVSAAPVPVRSAIVQRVVADRGRAPKEARTPVNGQRNEMLQASMKRDLFTPLGAVYEAEKRAREKTDSREPQLEAILFDVTDPMAIINNQVVGVGAVIDQYTVIHVGEKEVVLAHGDSKRVLRIDKE